MNEERVILLSLLYLFSYGCFGIFIGLLIGFDRPTLKRGYNTFTIITTLTAFAGGAILTYQDKKTHYLLIGVLGFSIGAIIGYVIGKFIMECKIYPQERKHSEEIEKIKPGNTK